MQELINITTDAQGAKIVSARELHTFLESKQDFSTWIKGRIEKYGFVEGQDFITAPQIYGTANGGHGTRLEYALTMDTAKELSMVECNAKGREARQYFIARDKELSALPSPQDGRIEKLEGHLYKLTQQLEQAGLFKFLEHNVTIESISPVTFSRNVNGMRLPPPKIFMTVHEYGKKHNVIIPSGYITVVSNKAKKWCRERSIIPSKIGYQNSYPEEAIKTGVEYMLVRIEARRQQNIEYLKKNKIAQDLKMLEVGEYMIFPATNYEVLSVITTINRWTNLQFKGQGRNTATRSYKVTRLK